MSTPKNVRAKKHLGQHFLHDESIAERIGDTLTLRNYENVLEIGPGMGVLTKYIVRKPLNIVAMELDRDSVAYLHEHFSEENLTVIEGDFLKFKMEELFSGEQFAITGNFPY